VNSAFLQLYCLKFSFNLANISRSYEENKMAPYFVNEVQTVKRTTEPMRIIIIIIIKEQIKVT